MADEESQDICSVGGRSEHSSRSQEPEVRTQGHDVAAVDEVNPEKFESLIKNVEEVGTRLDNIHKFILDLGNYYFAFQGVCLAAISNTSFFVCDNAWFLTLLSILSAIPSLVALGFLAHEWINLTEHFETNLTVLKASRMVVWEEYACRVNLLKKCHSVLSGNKYSYVLRYSLLVVGVVIILCFTAIVAAWPHVMICQNKDRSVFDKKGFN